ncbi:hypothetical protein DPMN_077392 [Dreissena polymorpha]|uniref:Reverse transcriptase domain-containing protein n=1 Tax=Dreissena polymorpha TaxID=45954 RepID=A0A9D3YKD7_DREPO|nr:hypothetical protein DPMN_077392 [Dreissena polymorpha]
MILPACLRPRKLHAYSPMALRRVLTPSQLRPTKREGQPLLPGSTRCFFLSGRKRRFRRHSKTLLLCICASANKTRRLLATPVTYRCSLLQGKSFHKQNTYLFSIYVDMTESFDTVSRDGQLKIMAKNGCPRT